MVTFSSTHRYYLYREPTDMRKGFDGLAGLVVGCMKRFLLSGEVFIFLNRRRFPTGMTKGQDARLGQNRLRAVQQTPGAWHFRAAPGRRQRTLPGSFLGRATPNTRRYFPPEYSGLAQALYSGSPGSSRMDLNISKKTPGFPPGWAGKCG